MPRSRNDTPRARDRFYLKVEFSSVDYSRGRKIMNESSWLRRTQGGGRAVSLGEAGVSADGGGDGSTIVRAWTGISYEYSHVLPMVYRIGVFE